jgi:hypothetical protein
MVASSLGELFKFDTSHPTGHYKLDLADNYQFMLAQRLQVCSFSSCVLRFACMHQLCWQSSGVFLQRCDICFLQMQSNQEARQRAALSLFDLSQRGNGQTLRNTTINGDAVRISGNCFSSHM